jgi:predicted GIY-YIG superfamily endonuclease
MINVLTLPKLLLSERFDLPRIHAVYLVLTKENKVVYIGSAMCLWNRLNHHEKLRDFELSGGYAVAWIQYQSLAEARKTEIKLIKAIAPPLNYQYNQSRKKRVPSPKSMDRPDPTMTIKGLPEDDRPKVIVIPCGCAYLPATQDILCAIANTNKTIKNKFSIQFADVQGIQIAYKDEALEADGYANFDRFIKYEEICFSSIRF